ncbi:DgyrCDS13243 [Dimorphilus gyrociliatus]|uniref:DgyrCDS13243 n=1 Tax=Dimorphilus gyrociliatus TaxID=2664684 RepID=A0A7I8WA35_9ANNE|nr:DgyrCDS13243 [Dimorphilus gyrociliatus]
MINDSLCSILFFIFHSSNGVPVLHGQDSLTTYYVGNMNLIITVPHNGQKAPVNISDRTKGCTDQNNNCVWSNNCSPQSSSCKAITIGDGYTKNIAMKCYNRVHELTGLYPHMIISELRRVKMDPNREINEATFGDPIAIQVYNDFHGFIDQAKNSFSEHGLLIDMHGQTHPEQWIELGYLISKHKLVNNILDPSTSSIKSLNSRFNNISFESLLRGSNSFGKLLNDYSYNVVPSPNNPDPTASGNYYSGGFITKTYGSSNCGNTDAIQIEAPKSIRFNSSIRNKFARDLGDVIVTFMQTYYGLAKTD